MTLLRCLLLATFLTYPVASYSTRVRESLEAYDRKDLVVWSVFLDGTCGPTAWIRDPNGFMHKAFLGSYVGKDSGLVKQVTQDGVMIRELFEAGKNDWRERDVW